MNSKWLFVASGILLLLGIPTGWPYDYYILLRWFICISAIITASGFHKSGLSSWTLTFGAIAILFNPLFPVHLTKTSWIPIDLVSAILFFLAAYSFNNQRPR